MANVLITVVGPTTALSIIKGLRQQKEIEIKIISFDIDEVFY